MLSTLLGQLQGYFNKYFVVGCFSPMLAWAFVNGGIAYFVFDSWRIWADANILNATATGAVFMTTSLVVAIVLAAYVLSSLSTFLRQQLEGKWWGGVGRWFVPAQNRRRRALIGARDEAFQEMADLASAEAWEVAMRNAEEAGRANHPAVVFAAPDPDPAAQALTALEAQRDRDGIVTAAALKNAADRLVERLSLHNADHSPLLRSQHMKLVSLIDHATADYYAEGARGRHARLQNEVNSNFGAQDVAPTKMGNVANTIQSYAMRRYRCNLEILWSNLMQIVQGNEKAQASLQEAKTQLDFLVACCWLTLLTAAIWSVIFLCIVPNRFGFLLAALLGPLAAYLWYRAAAEQYRSFADVAMTLFDTFRFDLLRAMHLRPPADVEEESHMWATIDKLVTFGEEGNFRYERGTPQPPGAG